MEIFSSFLIVVFQYSVVCFIACFLMRQSSNHLNNPTTRNRIGNLYLNLDTRARIKLFFGLAFFVQRILAVLFVSVKYNFAIQWQLCQLVLLLNTSYLMTAKPYQNPENATLDYINCLFLLAICILMTTYSHWNTSAYGRLLSGIVFDAIVCLQFAINMFYITSQFVTQIIRLGKRYRLRYKNKKLLQAKRAEKAR